MRSELDVAQVEQVLRSFEGLALDDDDDALSVVAESSLDEAMLVGSSKACVKLARELIRVALAFESDGMAADLENGNVVNQGEKMTDSIKALFDEDADAWPVCLCVTPSRNVTRAIRDALRGQ